MNGRTIGIGVAVVVGVSALGVGGYFGIKKLVSHPPHNVVVTFRRHASAADNDTRIAAQTAHGIATRSPHIKRIRSVATRDRVTIECSFDSKPLEYDQDKEAIDNTVAQVLHSFTTFVAPPLIEDAEPESRMWVLANKDLYAQLDEIRGVTVWHGCGSPLPKRIRVHLDGTKLDAYKADPADFVQAIETAVTAGSVTPDKLVDYPVKGYVTLGKVASVETNYTPPPDCTTLTPDGQEILAMRMSLHPKIAPEDRGKVDAVIKEANATLIGAKDYTEVRFFAVNNAKDDEEVQLARSVLRGANSDYTAKHTSTYRGPPLKTNGLPVIAATMTNEGIGTLLVKKDASDDEIRDFFKKTPQAGWGGIRGGHYLQITVTDRDRNVVDTQVQILSKKVGLIAGLGQRILTSPPTRAELTFDIDEVKALADGIDAELIRALVPGLSQGDTTLPVLFEAPFDGLTIRGKPFSDYVSTRTTMAPARLLRINAMPAVELRWELADSKPMKRVRQVVGESAAVTVDEVLPASR